MSTSIQISATVHRQSIDPVIERAISCAIASQCRPISREGVPPGDPICRTQHDAIVVHIAEPPAYVQIPASIHCQNIDPVIERAIPGTITAQGRPVSCKGIPFGDIICCGNHRTIVA